MVAVSCSLRVVVRCALSLVGYSLLLFCGLLLVVWFAGRCVLNVAVFDWCALIVMSCFMRVVCCLWFVGVRCWLMRCSVCAICRCLLLVD